MTPEKLRKLAYQYAHEHNIKGFSKFQKMAGRKWMQGFLRRYPSIKLKKANNLSLNRAMCANRPTIDNFFRNLKALTEKLGITSAEQLWNTDETGVQDIPRPQQVVGAAGKRAFRTVAREQGETTTVLTVVNGAGKVCPPLVIFKGRRYNAAYGRKSSPGTMIRMSPKGYINKDIFTEYLVRWLRFLRTHRLLDRPHILLLDSHGSHVYNVRFLEAMKSHNVHVLAIPAHTSHLLQPLDGPPFALFKRYWYEEMCEYSFKHAGLALPKEEFWVPFVPAWNKAMTVSVIQAGFRQSGIYPFDPTAITDADLGPSAPTDNLRNLRQESKTQCSEGFFGVFFGTFFGIPGYVTFEVKH